MLEDMAVLGRQLRRVAQMPRDGVPFIKNGK
jgi:hypothetical protein